MQITNVQSFAVRALGTVLALAVLAGAFACGYFLGLRNAGDVSDHGGGAATVGRQLDQAETDQRGITAGLRAAEESNRGLADSLDRSAGAVDRSKAAADGLAAANSDITGQVDEAGTIIERSQRILQEIRSRSEADQGTH